MTQASIGIPYGVAFKPRDYLPVGAATFVRLSLNCGAVIGYIFVAAAGNYIGGCNNNGASQMGNAIAGVDEDVVVYRNSANTALIIGYF